MTLLGIYLYDGTELVTKNLKKNTWFPFAPISVDSNGFPDLNQMKNFIDNTSFLYNQSNIKNPTISINCLVGKNGSGKSALLDLLYRLINNLSYYLLGKHGYDIEYAYGFKAELYFSISNKKTNNIFCFFSNDSDDKLYKNNKGYIASDFDSIYKTKLFLEKMFYTIVTNYSNYSFNQSDYLYNKNLLQSKSNKYSRKTINGKWLTNLFNKNDSYTTPLVITPYRNSFGIIDVAKEDHLAKNRIISALLLFYNLNETEDKEKYDSFIEGYKPAKLSFRFNHYYDINQLYKKLQKIIKIIPGIKENYKNISDENIKNILNSMNDAWQDIINEKKIITTNVPLKKFQQSINYLSYKTLKIISWYELYQKEFPTQLSETEYTSSFKKVINALLERPVDHISIKIFQTLNYMQTTIYDKRNTINVDLIKPYKNQHTIDNYLVSLPPPFFNLDIILSKKNKEKTSISKMSSGEKQFLYSLSYIIYHLANLNNKNSKPNYKHILLIFDEVELYLHPEWQRLYISKLLTVIQKCHFSKIESINILIATHSPFLLSDIPSSNILALTEGNACKKEEMKESFCANYYDLLSNQFFLDYSIGERAREIIYKLIDIARKNKDKLTSDEKEFLQTNKQIIEIIADPFLVKTLQTLGINND